MNASWDAPGGIQLLTPHTVKNLPCMCQGWILKWTKVTEPTPPSQEVFACTAHVNVNMVCSGNSSQDTYYGTATFTCYMGDGTSLLFP